MKYKLRKVLLAVAAVAVVGAGAWFAAGQPAPAELFGAVQKQEEVSPADLLEAEIEAMWEGFDVVGIGEGKNNSGQSLAMVFVACYPEEKCMGIPAELLQAMMQKAVDGIAQILPDADSYVVYFISKIGEKWMVGSVLGCAPTESGRYQTMTVIRNVCQMYILPAPVEVEAKYIDRVGRR